MNCEGRYSINDSPFCSQGIIICNYVQEDQNDQHNNTNHRRKNYQGI